MVCKGNQQESRCAIFGVQPKETRRCSQALNSFPHPSQCLRAFAPAWPESTGYQPTFACVHLFGGWYQGKPTFLRLFFLRLPFFEATFFGVGLKGRQRKTMFWGGGPLKEDNAISPHKIARQDPPQNAALHYFTYTRLQNQTCRVCDQQTWMLACCLQR